MLRGRTSIELTRNCNIQCVPEGVAPDEIVGDQVPGASRTLVLEVTAPPLLLSPIFSMVRVGPAVERRQSRLEL